MGTTKTITLSQGKVAIVDTGDFIFLNQWKWSAVQGRYTHYAFRTSCRNGTRKTVRMHRVILGARKGKICDHINGNGLDNRRSNLRISSYQQNNANSRKRRDAVTSQYKGVHYQKPIRKWVAKLHVNNRQVLNSRFTTELEAAKAYDRAVKKFNSYSKLNFPSQP